MILRSDVFSHLQLLFFPNLLSIAKGYGEVILGYGSLLKKKKKFIEEKDCISHTSVFLEYQ